MASYGTQTTFLGNYPVGMHGQIASEEKYNAASFTVQNAGGIPFGALAGRGTADRTCIPMATGGKLLGVVVMNPARGIAPNGVVQVVDGYSQTNTAAVMTEGTFFGTVDVAVAQGDPVYWVAATNRYTNVATNNIALPRSFFDVAATAAGQIVRIVVDHRFA